MDCVSVCFAVNQLSLASSDLSPVFDSAEGGNQLSFAFNQVPVVHTRHDTWDSRRNSKVMNTKPGLFTTMKSAGTDELQSTQNELQSPGTKFSPGSMQSLSFQGTPYPVFQRGMYLVLPEPLSSVL